jgi:radical SAM family protein/iron-sulfur cluster protein
MRMLVNNLGHKLRRAVERRRDVRAYDPNSSHPRVRGPREIQIQTVDRCNATCIMCPYSSRDKAVQTNVMDDDLFRRILNEISRFDTVKIVRLMLQNEPLLDRKLPSRARIAREVLGPSVQITTVTNGTPLTTVMIDALADSGIDRVSVSIDAIQEDTYRKIRQGLNFQRVLENTLALIERLGPRRVGVSFLRQPENEGEEGAFARYWRRHGVRLKFGRPTNRAGVLESFESVRQSPDLWMKLVYPALNQFVPACPLPFYTACILWDGKPITCANDWGPRDTVGDLSTETLEQVWYGEKMNHYRHLLRTRRAQESLVCAGCSQAENYWNL